MTKTARKTKTSYLLRSFGIAAMLVGQCALLPASPLATINNIDWYAEQGTKRNGTPITDAQRTNPLSIFDASDNRWLSLGFRPNSDIGGRVYGTALDGFYLSGTLEIREATFGVVSANYPEGVQLRFSGSLTGASDIVLQLNQTPASCGSGLTCSATVLNSETTQWLVSGFDGSFFRQIEVADSTRPLTPAKSDDGFDLGYINASTSPVPEPSSLLLISGASCLALARRFRRR